MPPSVVVVGAGVAGLSVARLLRERSPDLEVHCLEAALVPGGHVRTDAADGFRCEWGANAFLDNSPPTLELVRQLGLSDRLVEADPAAKIRWVFRAGRLRKIVPGPGFLVSDVLPRAGMLRLLTEPLRRRRSERGDESVHEFAARRLGKHAARILMDAVVAGIHAGDAGRLSLEAAFPEIASMEREHGSLFRALLAKRGPRGALRSFRDGMQEVPEALARALGPVLRLGVAVRGVADMGRRGFRVYLHEGAPIDARAVVLACPVWAASEIVAGMDAAMAKAMAEVPSAAVTVVHMGFETAAVGDRIVGFGFLVPRGEGPRILGTLFSSNIFPNRAPEGMRLLTTMVGGAHSPEDAGLPDEAILALARADLRTILGIESPEVFSRVHRHGRGLPQYNLGHLERVAAIDARLAAHPGLLVCGNSYRGISINSCIAEAPAVAERVLGVVAGAA